MSHNEGIVLDIWAILIVVLFILLLLPKRPRKKYGVKSVTNSGETVKSYSEKRLADYFESQNIRYQYEPGLRGIYANPDFYLPDYGVYVEYWGLLDADDPYVKRSYEKKMKRKMAIYHQNKIKFISIYPQNMNNLDWIFRKKFEKVTGKRLPN